MCARVHAKVSFSRWEREREARIEIANKCFAAPLESYAAGRESWDSSIRERNFNSLKMLYSPLSWRGHDLVLCFSPFTCIGILAYLVSFNFIVRPSSSLKEQFSFNFCFQPVCVCEFFFKYFSYTYFKKPLFGRTNGEFSWWIFRFQWSIHVMYFRDFQKKKHWITIEKKIQF